MSKFRAYAADGPHQSFKVIEYDPGVLGPDQVEIAVETCGVCHSDLSMLNNEWGISAYPFVGGHEVSGRVAALGSSVANLQVGQRVGLGWYAHSCLTCRNCLAGDHNLCQTGVGTVVGRHGGFAERVRAQATWVVPLPEGINADTAGPLFCGGITVFNPLIQFGVSPLHRVGVVGIGGLGHMALKFLKHWGCHVVAFTSPNKMDEALALGAHETINSRDPSTFAKLKGSLDFILVTANVPQDWYAYIDCLAPRGRLHFVGAVLEPVSTHMMQLIMPQKTISGSPLGSPLNTMKLLDFAARHKIEPMTEFFPMSEINKALKHVESGQARYRVVLRNDWK